MAHPAHVREWADRFAVLGDPSRLRLLLLVHREGPISVTDLAAASGLRPTAVSHALRLLRIARTVEAAREGRSTLYRLVDPVTADLLDHVPDPPAALLENGS